MCHNDGSEHTWGTELRFVIENCNILTNGMHFHMCALGCNVCKGYSARFYDSKMLTHQTDLAFMP